MKTAVLLTCFNRKEKTRTCLQNLFAQALPEGIELSVFVCDDNSADGSSEMLQSEFPQVQVTKGSGQLYWGGGMRKAWSLAKSSGQFDFFLWLNDDTNILPNGLLQLWEDYEKIKEPIIIVGACSIPGTTTFSYGGHGEPNPIPPAGFPQKVKFINGNLVLIPAEIEAKIGAISAAYTHYLGDYDYALRAQEAGFSCYTSSNYLAECDVNDLPSWYDSRLSISKRWKLAHHTKGLALREYVLYKSYHGGKWVGLKTRLDVYLKLIHPEAYTKFRNFILRKKQQ